MELVLGFGHSLPGLTIVLGRLPGITSFGHSLPGLTIVLGTVCRV